jgi:hypothetical protein
VTFRTALAHEISGLLASFAYCLCAAQRLAATAGSALGARSAFVGQKVLVQSAADLCLLFTVYTQASSETPYHTMQHRGKLGYARVLLKERRRKKKKEEERKKKEMTITARVCSRTCTECVVAVGQVASRPYMTGTTAHTLVGDDVLVFSAHNSLTLSIAVGSGG